MNLAIFTDAFLHRLLAFHPEVTLQAMAKLDRVAYIANAPFAVAGALLASALLYAIGVALRRLPAIVSTEAQQLRILQLHQALRGWLPYLLILSPTPMGAVLIMAAGFFAVRPWVAGLMLLLAELAWRASPVL